MMKFTFLSIQFFLFISFQVNAQIDTSESKTENTINQITIEPDAETDNSNLYDLLENLQNNPINLNSATISDLEQIPQIDYHTAKLIIDYRKKYGRIFSTSELYSIPNIDKEIINHALSYFTTKENIKKGHEGGKISSNEGFHIRTRNRMIEGLQQTKGYREDKFAGSKYKVYNRLIVTLSDKYEVGLLTDKDPGERSLNDFTSFHFSAKEIGPITKFVLGDYNLEFGQGLALWSQFGFSKGINAIYPTKKISKGIVPYRSSVENDFCRGAAATINFKNFYITGFYSKNKLDAHVDSVSNQILSTPITGLHRTTTEIAEKNASEEKLFGGNLEYQLNDFLETGFTYYNSIFSNPFVAKDVYSIEGSKFRYYSFYYNLDLGNINLFGESVYDGTSVANYHGIEISPSSSLSFVSSIRSYPRNYHNLHGFGFGEANGKTKNEYGIYTGLRLNTKAGKINLYYDQFKFPYATYLNPMPTSGNEFLLYYKMKPIKALTLDLIYKGEQKEITVTDINSKKISARTRRIYRIEMTFSPVKILRLKSRFQYLTVYVRDTHSFQKGFMIFQDIRFYLYQNFKCSFRTSFFKTDSFSSAIYMYENNLKGILYSIPLYGEGIHWSLVLDYSIFKFIDLAFRYAETYEPNAQTLGSSYSEINGNSSDKLGLQLDFKL